MKQMWIEALRSGDYEQGESYLKDPEGRYCCLGVLADKTCWEIWNETEKSTSFEPHTGIVIKEHDRDIFWGETLDQDRFNLSFGLQARLAEMNDSGKMFNEIADYLEQKLPEDWKALNDY